MSGFLRVMKGSGSMVASETDFRVINFMRVFSSQLPELFGATNSQALGEF